MRTGRFFLQVAFFCLPGACGSGEDITRPTLGDVSVTVTTTGAPDPDGFTLALDGGSPGPVGTTDTTLRTDLTPGDHRFELGGLAAGCEVQNPNPLVVTVIAGTESRADFTVRCPPPAGTGAIAVRVSTTGPETDPDGYTLVADPLPERSVASQDSLTIEGLTLGAHAVRLGGVAADCAARSANPEVVTVVENTVVPVEFEVSCWPAASGTMIFLRQDLDPDFNLLASDLYVEAADGTGLRNLTRTPDVEEGPSAWSPDGRAIAFDAATVDADGLPDGGHAIFVTDPTGGRPMEVASGIGLVAWSPTGGKILFEQEEFGLSVVDTRTLKVDTLIQNDFTGIPTGAAWSPDGRRIAIGWEESPPTTVRIMDPDGRHQGTIVGPDAIPDAGEFRDMDWSPDGRRIASAVSNDRSGFSDLFLLDPSGSAAPENLTSDPADYRAVSWSPDGSSLLFTKRVVGAPFESADIYSLRVADRQLVKLTASSADYSSPAWSPDGRHVVYVMGRSGTSDRLSSLFTVNADGSGTRQVTAGSHRDAAPTWTR